MTDHGMRRATLDDRDALLQLLSAAFSWPRAPCLDFMASSPHLLCDSRVGDHLLAFERGRMIGVVGIYPYTLRIGGVDVKAAGIGQVATAPDRRGRGVMRGLMQAAMSVVADEGFELAWLSGDRQRYARWGFAPGGVSVSFDLERRMLPEACDPSQVECLWPDDIVATIVASCETSTHALLMPADELAQLISAQRPIGARFGPAWLVHNLAGTELWFGDGPPDELAQLVSHVLTSTAKARIVAVCAPQPSPLNRLGSFRSTSMRTTTVGLWRIAKLERTLAAAARVARARVGPGRDSLALLNVETGERATLHCVDGELHVDQAGDAPIVLDTEQLSAMCFGSGPLEHWIPRLRPDSPLRQVLPLRPFHSPFYRF